MTGLGNKETSLTISLTKGLNFIYIFFYKMAIFT